MAKTKTKKEINEILKEDLKVLPLIFNFLQRTPLGNRKIILRKSKIHQTDCYSISNFYKPISKIFIK